MEEDIARERLPPPQSYPWLVYFHGEGGKNQTFCTLSDSDPTKIKTHTTSILERGKANLWALQHGWYLVLSMRIANASQLLLWNPCNLQRISLPPVEHNGIRGCVLSSSPTAVDKVCLLILFGTTSIFYFHLGDKQWTEVDYHEDLLRILALELDGKEEHSWLEETYLFNPVYCNGRLYAQSKFEHLLVEIEKLGPDGLKMKSTHVFVPESPTSHASDTSFLLESKNKLFHIETQEMWDKQNMVIGIVVHRLDFSQMIWEKVESIKDRVFFLSTYSSFACQAINPETEGGRIYFTTKLNNNNFMYIYNIEDKSLMVSHPFSNLPEKRSRPIWLMLDLRMNGSLRTELKTNKEEMGKAHLRGKESSVAIMEMGDRTTNAFALPLDMAEVIAKRLNLFDYLSFRATNRLFRSGAPPIQWRSCSAMSMSRFDDLSLSPLFVCFQKDGVLTFVHPKHGLKYKYSVNLPEVLLALADCVICSSKDGWLLLATNDFLTFFFNPFTKEVLPLAYGPFQFRNTKCVGFSHPPPSPKCVVVESIKTWDLPNMNTYITRFGEEEWERFNFEDSDLPLCNISPTFYRGAFYYLSHNGYLGVLEVQESISWEILAKPQAPCTGYYNSFLVECDGNLLSVFEGPFGKWVQVFMLNESTMTWIKVESLGNHMLFVGHTSFSAVANIPVMKNKIYFPRFCGQSIVFYSLETNKYHTFDNKDEVVNFHCAREQLHSCWIEPRWH